MRGLRAALLGVSVFVVMVLTPLPALAWSNGPGGPDSYGTHDWILDKAINAAGNKASWVKVNVALRATDDPDTKDGIDPGASPTAASRARTKLGVLKRIAYGFVNAEDFGARASLWCPPVAS